MKARHVAVRRAAGRELVAGAKGAVADGPFTRFPTPDYAFALRPSAAPYGTIRFNAGPMTSNSDGLEIPFKGRGGAAPRPTGPSIRSRSPRTSSTTCRRSSIPSMLFFIGVRDPHIVAASRLPGGKPLPFDHSPFFAPVPEPSIETGVTATSLAV